MKLAKNHNELLLDGMNNIFSYVDFVDMLAIALVCIGMVLVGQRVFTFKKHTENMGYGILMLWLNATPVYIGVIILGFKYGFN